MPGKENTFRLKYDNLECIGIIVHHNSFQPLHIIPNDARAVDARAARNCSAVVGFYSIEGLNCIPRPHMGGGGHGCYPQVDCVPYTPVFEAEDLIFVIGAL